jgi:hypothetical protein
MSTFNTPKPLSSFILFHLEKRFDIGYEGVRVLKTSYGHYAYHSFYRRVEASDYNATNPAINSVLDFLNNYFLLGLTPSDVKVQVIISYNTPESYDNDFYKDDYELYPVPWDYEYYWYYNEDAVDQMLKKKGW